MKIFIHTVLAAAILSLAISPNAIAADLMDVGFLDQATVASLPMFASVNGQLAQYQGQLDQQFKAAMRGAKTDADRQRITAQFQQQFSDKQSELINPLRERVQVAIAVVSASKNLSVVVDKRIIVYGGQDITKAVISAVTSSHALVPPSASLPASPIGFVDQAATLSALPKMKAAHDELTTFAQDQRKVFAQRINDAKTDAEKQRIANDYNKLLQDKDVSLVKPITDQALAVTGDVAKKKSLLLVLDRADVLYGGMDITQDVQNALNK